FPSVADAYNGLLGMDNNRVVNLPMSQLDEIDDQPFPINDSKVDQIADSIDAVGVLEPVIVAKNGDRYSILSGRHRFRACQKLGKTEIPCFIKDYSADDPTARFILLATNTDRNNEYAPTVYARAYAEQLELMKQLGKKATGSAIAENNNMSRKQIYRYIRLNELIAEFQQWVDKGIVTIEAAVELSFISEEKQHTIFEHINGLGIADSVITRHFKVAMTKKIHTVADAVSDEEFSSNIDKIIFSVYETKTTVPTAQVGLEVPLTAKQDKEIAEIPAEQAETIT
ncbi:MAG: ParB/RepB/Spo0J family partition protein, partial [Firmicutes bacterium]|nr:ParB/RepB/Spo0J family partition protein [Bacillota bacterium]